ncbi:O-antigen ligase family protein [Fulvivirga maritima]|uniref:O-antigen ligase family protein n=1 Tax=Fulvivirga maritima TaxID=2904247 RepID=UPI001F37AA9E|nr:O-antigen ligase family protein [Fulvivirga maritima]UII27947.1 O-antigen ligase family protein [Fulvivirga maritima]
MIKKASSYYLVNFVIALMLFVLTTLRFTYLLNNSIYNLLFGAVSLGVLFLYLYSDSSTPIKVNNLIILVIAILFLGIGMVGSLYQGMPFENAIHDLSRYLLLLALFYLGIVVAKFLPSRVVWSGLIIIFTFHLIYCLFDLYGNEVTVIHGHSRLSGYFEREGQFGTFLGLLVIFLYVGIVRSSGYQRFLCLVSFILFCFLLAANDTLRAIVILIGAFSIYYVIHKRKFIQLIILFLFLIIGLSFNHEVQDRLITTLGSSYNISEISGKKLDSSFQWRVLQWYHLVTDWFQNYLFFGRGLGQETELNGFSTPDGRGYEAHSNFVKILVETGLVGMTLFSIIMAFMIKKFTILIKQLEMEEIYIFFYYFLLGFFLGDTLFTVAFFIFIIYLGILTVEKNNKLHG